jgi:outer membrane lipoprotein-sorting protein
MKGRLHGVALLSGLVVAVLLPRQGAAQKTAAELLQKVDAVLTKSNNQYMVWEMTTVEAGKPDRTLTFEATVKGRHWRRMDFLAPADFKGMRLLVRSPTQMYIYLPQFKKVRRVASHVQAQGYLGTAFDYDEAALATYGDLFEAESFADKGSHWNLVLKRKEGETFRHAKIDLDLRKDNYQAVELRYMNEKGQVIKTETRSDFAFSGAYYTPRTVAIVDHTRGEIKTTMVLKKFKIDAPIDDDFFTVKSLQQGE